MLLAIRNMLKNKNSQIIFAIIWGFGLASLFQRVCKGNRCIIIKAPNPNEIVGSTYKFNEKCYQYTQKSTMCDKSKDIYSE
jgi:hypothetical protein